ncbi:hypothetical protein R1flu_016075 [Riccia fluitans]|uniref:glycerophosphodiester phosphodiesterase n=1 Tax=Riccia fluitans TaxID=41844 RepID=A0ABD1YNX5_9MARC
MPSLFENAWGLQHARARRNNAATMLRRRQLQLPRPGLHSRRLPFRFSFRNFVFVLLLLGGLTIAPSIYFFLTETEIHDCDWLENPPLVCAHGGDTSNAPANTLAAYQLALDAGVNCIEIDASRARDGVLMALHDRELSIITGHPGARVGNYTVNKIRQLDASAGSQFKFSQQQVPTLEEALLFIGKSVRQIIVDAKVGPPLYEQRLSKDILSVIKKTECSNCIVWAKNDTFVEDITRHASRTKTGYIVMKDLTTGKASELVRLKGAEIVGIYYGLVNGNVVSHLHRHRKQVHAWTVDTREAMSSMLKANVDAIITCNPRLLQRTMEDERQVCTDESFGIH